jgi:hypothetical protein
LIAAQKAAAIGTRKRKAGEDSTNGRREHTKRPFAQRKEQAESTKKRISDRFTAQSETFKPAKELIHDRYKEAVGKGDGGEESSRSAPANRPKRMAIDFKAPREGSASSKRTNGREQWGAISPGCFMDENGKDVGYPPIELKNRCSADRAHLHQACDGFRAIS